MTDQEPPPVHPSDITTSQVAIDIKTPRPALTINAAAKAAGVHRNTIRRRLDRGEFSNRFRERDDEGREGPWLIPTEDLLAAGFRLHAPSAPDSAPPPETLDELQALRAENLELRHRAEMAEALARERDRALELAERALRALESAEQAEAERDHLHERLHEEMERAADDPNRQDVQRLTLQGPQSRRRRWASRRGTQ